MATICFQPAGVEVESRSGETVFDTAQREGLDIDTACVGKGTCGLCRVRIVDGEALLNDYNDIEEKHLGNVYYLTKLRLACQVTPLADGKVVVEPSPKKRPKK